jgi:hypothetical protein
MRLFCAPAIAVGFEAGRGEEKKLLRSSAKGGKVNRQEAARLELYIK